VTSSITTPLTAAFWAQADMLPHNTNNKRQVSPFQMDTAGDLLSIGVVK